MPDKIIYISVHLSPEKAEREVQTLKEELETKKKELEARKMMQLGNSQKYQENDTCVTSQDSDKGHIVVDEVDPEGKYVRLYNKSKTDQEMTNWELYLHVNNKKPNIYTFRTQGNSRLERPSRSGLQVVVSIMIPPLTWCGRTRNPGALENNCWSLSTAAMESWRQGKCLNQ
ncbi:hypothetical protein PFLUV_G00169320 [Perca fluviatilis]|uniref:LTD domain-containing protein n=1 Tax=Perca fluviatilis TaxID=8168 RepID=A0A6A5EZ34_PERFL|nr:hypothetical protein PFLUV_G00169320 [Perca fluviatilis]